MSGFTVEKCLKRIDMIIEIRKKAFIEGIDIPKGEFFVATEKKLTAIPLFLNEEGIQQLQILLKKGVLTEDVRAMAVSLTVNTTRFMPPEELNNMKSTERTDIPTIACFLYTRMETFGRTIQFHNDDHTQYEESTWQTVRISGKFTNPFITSVPILRS
jgi:hypothetical protein